jgi:hypothetical protein
MPAKSRPRVKLFRSIPCLTPEVIDNRFVNATNEYTDIYFRDTLKPDPLVEKMRVQQTMKEHKCSEKKARQIIKKEKAAWSKHYDSPLGKAERRIQELEQRLETIKEFINDPNYLDRFDP